MILHILNGDCTRMILERTGLPGETLVWTDVLHEGPAPAGLSHAAWQDVRARFHAGDPAEEDDEGPQIDVGAQLRAADARLARYREYDEVVFWLEHDLFDQLLLIRHLAWLASLARRSRVRGRPQDDMSRFRLICIDRFAGHPRFNGLGELNAAELASLFPKRQPITPEQIATGVKLWQAFGGRDPRALSDLVTRGDTRELPFAAGALRRHLEDFPSIRNGLSRTEQQILSAVQQGNRTAEDVFRHAAAREERVYMGDTTFFTHMQRLTRGQSPLLAHDGQFRSGGAPSGEFTLTAAGLSVLEGDADAIDLNGIDRWMGGVRLTDGRYRWTGEEVVRINSGSQRNVARVLRRPQPLGGTNSMARSDTGTQDRFDDEMLDAGGQGSAGDEDAMMEGEGGGGGRGGSRSGSRGGSRKSSGGGSRKSSGGGSRGGSRKGGGSRKAGGSRKGGGARKRAGSRKGARKSARGGSRKSSSGGSRKSARGGTRKASSRGGSRGGRKKR